MFDFIEKTFLKDVDNKFSMGLIHGDIKLENILCNKSGNIIALLDFDDYRYSYLLEETTMALMHNLDSKDENLIRSGNMTNFLITIKNKELLVEINKGLSFFLKTRFLYDVIKYIRKGNITLVEELFGDPFITDLVISN
jgi:serine/threonine protein kinase